MIFATITGGCAITIVTLVVSSYDEKGSCCFLTIFSYFHPSHRNNNYYFRSNRQFSIPP